jgi:hypothetical protein
LPTTLVSANWGAAFPVVYFGGWNRGATKWGASHHGNFSVGGRKFIGLLRAMRPRCWSGSPVICNGESSIRHTWVCNVAPSMGSFGILQWGVNNFDKHLIVSRRLMDGLCDLCRYCWQLLLPRAILLLSPRAILLTAALASSDLDGSCSRLERKFLGLSAFDASSLSVRQSCHLESSVSFASLPTLCHRCQLPLSV